MFFLPKDVIEKRQIPLVVSPMVLAKHAKMTFLAS
jgi:hypothetical protein